VLTKLYYRIQLIMENKFYVYVHTRATDGSIFYVGKGEGKRAWSKNRNKHWKNIATKHGYNVTILLNNLTEEQAFILEKQTIATLGRESLCNMTDGGDGIWNCIRSNETRQKLREQKLGDKNHRFGIKHNLGFAHILVEKNGDFKVNNIAIHEGRII